MELLNSYLMALRPFLGLPSTLTLAGGESSVSTGSINFHRGIRALESLARNLRHSLTLWRERSRQRRCLQDMSPHMLRDIGVERGEALREATKPFWRQ